MSNSRIRRRDRNKVYTILCGQSLYNKFIKLIEKDNKISMSNRVKIKRKINTLCCGNCKYRNNGFCTVTTNRVWKYDKPCHKYVHKDAKIVDYFGQDVYDKVNEYLEKENNNDDSRFYSQEEIGANNSDNIIHNDIKQYNSNYGVITEDDVRKYHQEFGNTIIDNEDLLKVKNKKIIPLF